MSTFPLLDEYVGTRLGVDIAHVPVSRLVVVASERRLRREESYGFVRALWWLRLADGRSVVSVPPGTDNSVERILRGAQDFGETIESQLAGQLRVPLDRSLRRHGLGAHDRTLLGLSFGCNDQMLRYYEHEGCHRLIDARLPLAEGLSLPTHCLPDGIVYGVVVDGEVASVAYAHATALMQDRVADIGIETAPAYRRRGLAKAAVSAVVRHIGSRGGEAIYSTAPGNLASIATAQSVGFITYASSMSLCAPSNYP